ncbi:MAG: alpha/beta hydrolase [Acidobacteria bacterium]|jgi:acetyl esterase/lipase|nr:alpha/beta hydrolase [Acidobacteriota bacterium]MBA4182741.1 alpha/beta hydrolase [Acidobacteriota bacterium]
MNRLILSVILFLVSLPLVVAAQEFIPLWEKGKMPNSKGIELKDDIRNERIYQVGTPGFYAFFPSNQENKGAAVLICPGGGYQHLAYIISGMQLAKWFNTLGISAFVLNYRLPNSPDVRQREIAPLQDAQRAMRIIRANAEKWQIKPDKIGVLGTSAGGHLAANLGTSTEDATKINDELDKFPFNPNFMILVSPVITMGEYAHAGSRKNLLGENPSRQLIEKYSLEKQVTATTPPAFIVHAADDKAVNPRNSLMFYNALLDKSISASLHIFPNGGHAIALRNNPGSTETWTNLCEMWLTEMGFIPQVKK